jgi:hypothetical protein
LCNNGLTRIAGHGPWGEGNYTIQGAQPDMDTEIGREQARIQRQFPWINPELELIYKIEHDPTWDLFDALDFLDD